ncbi:MAG: molybdopterin-dependent oxidoreductase [Thaumarchaeota archaeon]|nr:molybdopterin-dependent oxidoreductase [Nitrososphaerota archaeon]
MCGLIAHVEAGKIIKLEGDPDNPRNNGHLCAKGLSGWVNAYSPRRVRKPLLRTNPEKGLGLDPHWKEVSWEEAISAVAEKVKQVKQGLLGTRKANPPVFISTFDHWSNSGGVPKAWAQALDGLTGPISANSYCGKAVHPPCLLNLSAFEHTVDAKYSKYVLLIGAQAGSIIHYDTMRVAKHMAEGRPGGIRVVVVDPLSGYAASKAEEWVPIRPGTDVAFILALVHLLLNEYKIFDAEFLKSKTNAPYLIGEDGHYVRDEKTGHPLIWDPVDGKAKVFDDQTIKDYALEGSCVVEDKPCNPAFQIVKEHVKEYQPEQVAEITSIPADTIRRIAKEVGEAASIGQTITIDGKVLPYRPISISWYRGLSAHKHGTLAGLAALILPTILGAIQVPGGMSAHPSYPESITEDGLLAAKSDIGTPYPPRLVSKPRRLDAFELFPISYITSVNIPAVLNNPEKFGMDPTEFTPPYMMFIVRDNPVRNTYAPENVVAGLKKIPFIVSFNVDLDETANSLADIVFPDIHHLEKLAESLYLRIADPGYWYAAKPVVKPPFEHPWDHLVSNVQILLEISERAGFIAEVYSNLNRIWQLGGTTYELDPNRKYAYEELVDRRLKSWLGPDKGLEWLMSDEGGLLKWHAKAEEEYKGVFRKSRIHLYYEFMLKAKEDVDRTTKELGIKWDTGDYQPVPDWKPCSSYTKKNSGYNLFLISSKMPIMAHAVGRFNPIPMQLVAARKHLDSLLINPETAAKLGIGNGDRVVVESWKGRKQTAVAYVTDRVHPEVVAVSQHKLDTGLDLNDLAVLEEDTMDFLSGGVDSCLLVKVHKA